MTSYIGQVVSWDGKLYRIIGVHERFESFDAIEVGRQFRTFVPFEEVLF